IPTTTRGADVLSTTGGAQNGHSVKLIAGIPKEVHPGERRVATTPETAKKLQKLGFEVLVECGAGEAADFPDARYIDAGCRMANDARELWSTADVILKVRAPEQHPTLGIHET